ncbi:rhamnogalacturonan acetylesterase [Streptomyces sp. NBC_01386]|uniref:rhamnogalacturonan acetylesterase n=1 Tax=Streptomyces sp. NBC_01386 TaxID=2903848 RepID=UPI00324C5E2D
MTRVFLAGDSTVAARPHSMAPMAGWGQALPVFLQGAEVVNAAGAGASSRSFLERGRLAWILQRLAPGDLLLISFGLIDRKPEPGRHTAPFTDFQWYLRQYVHGARDRGAHPVLVTSHDRRSFDAHGNMRHPSGLYPAAVRELAAALTVPLVDLHRWTTDWWRQAGPDGTRRAFLHLEPGEHPNYPEGIEDNTHLRPAGALECARHVADTMRVTGLLPPDHFRNLDVQYLPEDCLQWPDDHTFEQVTAERAVAA